MNKNRIKKKKKTHVPLRLNILFFGVFLLFSVLILRLGVVQIVHGDDYRRELERTEDITVNNTVPRGKILDKNLKTIIDNEPVDSITFTRYQGTKVEEMLETAEKLAGIIEKDTKKVTERDKKDFWILKNQKAAQKKITKKDQELFESEEIDEKELYQRQLDRITEQDLKELTKNDLEVLAIYREMASAKALTPQIIKNKDVTKEEVAIVSENLESLPGIDVTTDWNRVNRYDKTLQSVIGKVSSSESGLPLDKLDYYKSRDYSNNDRVGLSYLEKQYEDVLHGQKAKVKNVTDKSGNVLKSIPITEGQRGKDLVLSIDMDLQIAVEQIIEEELKQKKSMGGTHLLDRAFVVMMDPNTGQVLTMAGKQYKNENGKVEFDDFALGNITTAYAMGSVVKGATVLAGFESKVNTPGSLHYDTKMYFKGTKKGKGSYKNMGLVNATEALKKSSNVYMFKTAIEMGGGTYVKNGKLNINKDKAFDSLRYYYSQFGLGVRTGIDLPGELAGFKGSKNVEPGLVLDLSIGQYDMYTPMQLAQYASTIANGGNRIQPYLVKEVREPSVDPLEMGSILYEMSPKVLNRVDMKESHIDVVQNGFRQVMLPGGTAYTAFDDADYKPAGKTGTAEAFYDGPKKDYKNDETMNITLVGYAPYDNPEVAMSVVVPWAHKRGAGHDMSKDIGRKVMDKYFELKEKRVADSGEEENGDQVEEE